MKRAPAVVLALGVVSLVSLVATQGLLMAHRYRERDPSWRHPEACCYGVVVRGAIHTGPLKDRNCFHWHTVNVWP